VDQVEIRDEMRRAQAELHQLIRGASVDDLRRRSTGTRWTNRQLLFHMVFGYLIVRTLIPLVHALGRLGHSRGFAATLNATRRPFHVINYLGSCGGGQILTTHAMAALLDRTINALQRGARHRDGREPGPHNALSDLLGSLLQADDERARRLPLRHPALRPPPTPAHPVARRAMPQWGCGQDGRPGVTPARGRAAARGHAPADRSRRGSGGPHRCPSLPGRAAPSPGSACRGRRGRRRRRPS
jgi:hypothetical protein